jgi:thiol-disulfide isomerase/thioredoxin
MHLRILASPRFRRGKTSGPSLWILLALVLLGVLVARRFFNSGDSASAVMGDRMPELKVSGWLNTDQPPTNQSLMGKVVLIDCWATWCGPCLKKMPALIQLRDRFRDQGVVVLGLTSEDRSELPAVKSYLDTMPQLNWPIGYGAQTMFEKFGVRGIPTLIVLDRHGTIVSKGHDLEEAENSLIETLARG